MPMKIHEQVVWKTPQRIDNSFVSQSRSLKNQIKRIFSFTHIRLL